MASPWNTGPVVGRADQATGHRRVITKRHPVGPLAVSAVASDPQPYPTIPRCDILGAEAAAGQRCGARRLDHHVGRREQAAVSGRARRNRLCRRAFRRSSSRRSSRVRPAVPSGRPGFDLDDGGARLCQQVPAQRSGPHRRQVGHQQFGQSARRGRPAQLAVRGGAAAVSPSVAAGRPSSRARSVTVATSRPATQLHGRPWVVGDRVGLQQRGDGLDVVGPRQREGAPAVTARASAAWHRALKSGHLGTGREARPGR